VLFALIYGCSQMVEGRGLDAVGVRPPCCSGIGVHLFADFRRRWRCAPGPHRGDFCPRQVFGAVSRTVLAGPRRDWGPGGVIALEPHHRRCRARPRCAARRKHRALVQHASYAILRLP